MNKVKSLSKLVVLSAALMSVGGVVSSVVSQSQTVQASKFEKLWDNYAKIVGVKNEGIKFVSVKGYIVIKDSHARIFTKNGKLIKKVPKNSQIKFYGFKREAPDGATFKVGKNRYIGNVGIPYAHKQKGIKVYKVK